MTTAAQPDTATPLADLDTQIATLKERTRDVQAQRNTVNYKLEIARTLHGRALADGLKDRADAAAAEAKSLATDLEGLDRALVVLGDRMKDAATQRSMLEVTCVEQELHEKRAALHAATAVVERRVREFAKGELAELLKARDEARSAAGLAWGHKFALDRKAGRQAEQPIQSPAMDHFDAFPGLGNTIDALTRYGDGRTAEQQMVHAAQSLAGDMRHNASRRGVA